VKPKTKWAGAPIRKRRASEKIKSKGGRPRRHRPSEGWIKMHVRPWIPKAFDLSPRADRPITILKGGVPWALREPTKQEILGMLRGMTDDVYIAEEAYRYLAAKDGRRVKRDDRIDAIADWLKMDADKLKNWLNRSKRAR
jgi:hypothetical protein